MKTNSICDDKLTGLVGTELSRIGIFVPISEVEQSAVLIYAKLRKAYVESNNQNFVLDSMIKSDDYYEFLSSAVIIDLLNRTRLKQVRNPFELNSVLALLDGYLHKLSAVSGAKQFKASSIFKGVILDLPIDFIPNTEPSGTGPHELNGRMYYGTPPSVQPCTACYDEPTLCNNCDSGGDECFDTINMTIEYMGTCFGFRVDSELLGFNQPLEQCDIKVFKNFIKQGAKLFNKEADKIFMQMYRQHEELTDDGD